MSKEIIAAVIQSIAVIVAVILGFYVTRGTKKLDWRQAQANDFCICSKTYSETVSKIIVILFYFFIERQDKEVAQEGQDKEVAQEGINDLVCQLRLLEWEIKRYSLPAHKKKEQFLKCEAGLFKAISNIMTLLRDSSAGKRVVDLENIRELQNAFDKSARELHAELCALA